MLPVATSNEIVSQARANGVSIENELRARISARHRSERARDARMKRLASIEANEREQERMRALATEQRVRMEARMARQASWRRMVTIATARKFLEAIGLDEAQTFEDLKYWLCCKYNIRWTDILSARRDRPTTQARLEMYWLMKRHTSHSLPAIGRLVGGRDHTTVLNGVRRYEQLQRMKAGLEPIGEHNRSYDWDLIIPMEDEAA